MILLDTCVLIFDALAPEKLSKDAKKIIDKSYKNNQLYCSDISLWEIAMLIQKKRLNPGVECEQFLQILLEARRIQVLSINIKIATLSAYHKDFQHYDPADRLIAATALSSNAPLITPDKKLSTIPELITIW